MKGEETLYTRQFPNFDTYRDLAKNAVLVRRQGKVVQQTGQIIEAYNP